MEFRKGSNFYFEKLAAKFPGFEIREGQQKMFEDVFTAYKENQTCLIEAGTGTGKSLAYLIPALLWAQQKGEPTVIATRTIALQEQLIQKDIPFLFDALGFRGKAVLAKGMHNYVCLRKLFDAKEGISEKILKWALNTQEGSKSELPMTPNGDLWEQIGAESESCTHLKCPHYKECFFFKARREMADAHLIVANHHLLFADLAIREENGNFQETALFPGYKRLILDEAHHCEDVATQYFAENVNRRGIVHHLGRLLSDRGTGKLLTLYQKISEAYPQESPFAETFLILLPAEKRNLIERISLLFDMISNFFESLRQDDKCRIREEHFLDKLWTDEIRPATINTCNEGKRWIQSILLIEGKLKQMKNPQLELVCEGILADISGVCTRLINFFDILYRFIFSPIEPNKVRWIEGAPPDLHLMIADLEVAPRLSQALFTKLPTIVLCSATLSTQGSFTFLRKRLGIEKSQERIYPSPFNYETQTLLTVPIDLPDPSHPAYISAASEQIWKSIEISRGGAFVLFTSYNMMRECERLLRKRFHEKHYLLFCQGDENRSHLLHKFRHGERAILFGTDSFWEGVDVSGEALRCVIIVKLPFKVPSDPLFQARSEAIAQQGESPFFQYSLPQAIVKFKQGFGRLIRTKEDRGCVICLDPRLIKKGYGKLFLQSLPTCNTCFDNSSVMIKKLQEFYLKH